MKISKALFAATVLSFAVAAGAAPSQAGILDGNFGGGGVRVDNINQTVNARNVRTFNDAVVNAAIIKGNVRAKNVTQNVTLNNIRARGNSQQNYAIVVGE